MKLCERKPRLCGPTIYSHNFTIYKVRFDAHREIQLQRTKRHTTTITMIITIVKPAKHKTSSDQKKKQLKDTNQKKSERN